MRSRPIRNAALAALVAVLTAGCATPAPAAKEHVHEASQPAETKHGMHMMKKMREKMAAARTDAERHAVMSEHMEMMHSMMEKMMKRMDGMHPK
jgi:type IV pilus biogenesis protein CpaD/CtpE